MTRRFYNLNQSEVEGVPSLGVESYIMSMRLKMQVVNIVSTEDEERQTNLSQLHA